MVEPVRVVIADDDADMRMLVTIAVRKAGMVLAGVAEDGTEAWQSVRDQTPDIVVLDVSMPGLSGLDVCRLIRSDPLLTGIPILLLSAGVSGASREIGIEAGADDFMPKPFSPRLLVEKLVTLSQGRGSTE
ncbi:response regulator transcription factor [Mycetocola sp.]|uniref:response regulator transcription factor n=1 Tax=Mycetocola sp. TaxID=1871042 RepID=UPI00398A4229